MTTTKTAPKTEDKKDDGLKEMYKPEGRTIRCNPSANSVKAMLADGWKLTPEETK